MFSLALPTTLSLEQEVWLHANMEARETSTRLNKLRAFSEATVLPDQRERQNSDGGLKGICLSFLQVDPIPTLGV